MSNKQVYAHLLTWFQNKETSGKWEMWNSNYKNALHNPDQIINGKRDIASLKYPLIGSYDSNDLQVLEYQLLLMKMSGIDGVIIDWDGREINKYRHEAFEKMLPVIKKFGMKIIMCFEEWCGYWPKSIISRETQIQKAIAELNWLIDNVVSKPNYGTTGDKLPLLVFRKIPDLWFTNEEWNTIKSHISNENIKIMFNDVYDQEFHQDSDGYFTWVSGFDETTRINTLDYYQNEFTSYLNKFNEVNKDSNKILFGSVMPGFDDTCVDGWGDGPRIAPRYDMKRYKKSWDNMIGNNIDLVQIVTWNDWNEGSQIEPSIEEGYLDILETSKQIARYKNVSSDITLEQITIAQTVLELRRNNKMNEKQLNQLLELINSSDLEKAQHYTKKIKENYND